MKAIKVIKDFLETNGITSRDKATKLLDILEKIGIERTTAVKAIKNSNEVHKYVEREGRSHITYIWLGKQEKPIIKTKPEVKDPKPKAKKQEESITSEELQELKRFRKEKELREKYSTWKHSSLWSYAKTHGLKHVGRTTKDILIDAIIKKQLQKI